MPQGLQVFDAAGNLQVDIGSSLGRVLGSVDTSASSGSISDDGFSHGTPFFIVVTQDEGRPPSVSISGTTMTWTYASASPYYPNIATTIIYGIR